MNIEVNQSQRNAIVAGVIASLVVIYFIDPILTLLSKLLLSLSNILFTSYLDRLYAEISTGDPNFGFNFLLLFCSLPSFVCIIFLIKKALNLIGKRISKQLSEDNKENNRGEKKKKLYSRIQIHFVLLSILGLFVIADQYIRLKTSSTFHQYMTVVHPLISDKEYNELLAIYASMKNKADYDALIIKLRDTSEKFGIDLPENKLYPF